MMVLLLVALAVVAWAVFAYNRLVTLKNQVANGWKQIDVQLKRRHDLIPNLVAAVRGAMEFERDTLERVISARNRAVAASPGHESMVAEANLSRALRQLFAVAENYPQLRANENVLRLQEELTTTENQLGYARQYYNDVATQFNTQQDVFPAALIARQFGFQHAELFAADDAERAAPTVDLTLPTNR
ncbi:MAG: LemA family protein [Deltaproteobacteria bacterium]|nr:LemA family protein [Deltaproteobacteria bacterium]